MRVVIIRHGKVDYRWKKSYTSKEFDLACKQYDKASIETMTYEVPCFDYHHVLVSTLSRSRDTARVILGDLKVESTDTLNEVPLRSCFKSEKSLPIWFWNVAGRLQWMFNRSRQIEGRRETRQRANQFIDLLCSLDEDSAVVTHGFYMHTLLKEMKKRGFTISKTKMKYKNGNYVIAER